MFKITGLVLMLTLALGTTALACVAEPEPTPPGIVISTDDSVCGKVTVTAKGFGVQPGEYQLVANQATQAVKVIGYTYTVSAVFIRPVGEWGTVAIRTQYGGYLAATSNLGSGTSWYHVRSC